MRRSTERILTTHAGSLPRPDDLLDMVVARDQGQTVDDAAFEARLRSSVAEVVQKQVAAGIDVISDGEMSKTSFSGYVNERLGGFGGVSEGPAPGQPDVRAFPDLWARVQQPGGRLSRTQPACVGPVTYQNVAALQRDLSNFRSALDGAQYAEAFLPALPPGFVATFHTNRYYPSHEEYLFAVADAMRVEYEAIVDAGFLLQLDAPDLAVFRNTWWGGKPLEEFRAYIAIAVAAMNRALVNIPADRVRLHVCWGNWAGPHHLDIPLADILDLVVQTRAGALYIEAFNPRHEHEWTVFEKTRLPEGMALIVGMIDTKSLYLEHPAAIAQRLERYARLVGRENLVAGTDCGFGTSADRTTTPPDLAWAKLGTLVQGARLASEALWPITAVTA